MQVNHLKSPWLTSHHVMDDLPLKQEFARSGILSFSYELKNRQFQNIPEMYMLYSSSLNKNLTDYFIQLWEIKWNTRVLLNLVGWSGSSLKPQQVFLFRWRTCNYTMYFSTCNRHSLKLMGLTIWCTTELWWEAECENHCAETLSSLSD